VQVADTQRNASNAGPPNPDLRDQQWHMVTLSSQPDGSFGFRMYIDGALAGQMAANQTYTGVHACMPLYHSKLVPSCIRC
jgi:hypothetical protein